MSDRELKEINDDLALFEDPDVREEYEREWAVYRAQVMRDLCSALGFWTVCRGKRCKRFKRCEGDTDVCFPRYWPLVAATRISSPMPKSKPAPPASSGRKSPPRSTGGSAFPSTAVHRPHAAAAAPADP